MRFAAAFVFLLHFWLVQDAQQTSFPVANRFSDILSNPEKETSGPNGPVGNKVDRFVAKHLFNPNDYQFRNSFDLLAHSPTLAEKFIIEMNLQLYEGGILPVVTATQAGLPSGSPELDTIINNELARIKDRSPTVTVVDSSIEAIVADIQDDFNRLKNTPDFVKHFQAKPKRQSYLLFTNNEYTFSDITYEVSDVDSLVFKARQLKSKLEIGINENGMPVHFEAAANPDNIVKDSREIFRKTKQDLLDIAIKTRQFWSQFKEAASTSIRKMKESGVINKRIPEYAETHTKVWGEGTAICGRSSRSKRSAGLVCAIDLDFNGKVKDIRPGTFFEEYALANERQKQEMLDMVVKNPDKVIAGTEEEAKLLWNLVEREQIKQHHEKIQDIKDVQLPIKQPSSDYDNVLGDFLDFEGKVQNLGPDVKLSPHKTSQKLQSLTSSEGFKRLGAGASAASGIIGIGFMAKTIATGIIHNDTTSLAIIGARVGYEVISMGIDIGTNLLKQASKVGKATKAIGKVTGPIGDIADIGLSVWSLVKSGQALHNATNKYDRNDAIIDIVSTSIDIVVTATLAILSVVFAPFAPFFALAGVVIDFINQLGVALFKAGNEVARINSEIPLHGYEKRQVFESRLLDIFGTRKLDYIDYLVAEKQANDAVVQSLAKFLEENQDFRGIVVPSMTVEASGRCELWRRHCRARMAGGKCLAGQWESWEKLATKCEFGRPCYGHRVCKDFTEDLAKRGRDHYECRYCGGGAEMKFDTPRSNSLVDFRNTQNVYWERAVPSDVENAAFQCKPGSKNFIHFTVSQDNPRNGYLCENAIGLLQPTHKRKPGQIMLFKLEDGNDKIYLNKNVASSPNMFLMGNQGEKIYEGGYDKNDFVFSSNCSSALTGQIIGGPGSDSVIIGEYCAKNKRITMDFKQGELRSQDGKLSISVSQVEQLVGRENQGETINAACSTRNVISRGGSSSLKDDIQILDDSSCKYNITILATDYTVINSRARQGNLVIPISGTPTGLQVNMDIYPTTALSTTILFMNVGSSQANLTRFSNSTNELVLGITANYHESLFTFSYQSGSEKSALLYFTELPESAPMSILYATVSGGRMFYHTLPKMSTAMSRTGNPFTENVFEISGDTWSVTGGNSNDEFILNTLILGTLNGGLGVDTLRFHQNFTQTSKIDLQSQQYRSIENVIGNPLTPLDLVTGCDTELVSTQGGSQVRADTVTVPNLKCGQKPIRPQILANGHIGVTVARGITVNDSMSLFIDGTSASKTDFSLTTHNSQTENFFVNILLNHTNLDITNISFNPTQQTISYQLIGGSQEKLKFSLKQHQVPNDSPYTNSPFIQISAQDSKPGIFLIDKGTLAPQVYYEIDETETSSNLNVQGVSKIKNIFRLASLPKCTWNATGGEKDDMFMLAPRQHNTSYFTIDGFKGENTLLIETHEEEYDAVLEINFVEQTIGYQAQVSGKVNNIHSVIGRSNTPDVIYPSCITKSIAGGGGRDRGDLADRIEISNINQSCAMELTAVVDPFTSLTNNATKGNFVYLVNDLITSEIRVDGTTNSSHYFHFSFHPWKQVGEIGFDHRTEQLTWKSRTGQEETTHSFKMTKPYNFHDYNNPIFHFAPAETLISSEIQVAGNGLLYSTITVNENPYPEKIEGLQVHLNRVILNITQTTNSIEAGGVIEGCSEPGKCLANQFFIVNLGNTIISVLDGGARHEKGGINYLDFSDNLHGGAELVVDLDVCFGFVQTNTGDDLVSRLQNIHEFHGNKNTTAIAGCETRQISGVDHIVVKDRNCSNVDMIVGLENQTVIRFEPLDAVDDAGTVKKGTIHYRFTQVVSFNPLGDLKHIQSYNHNYYFTFNLFQLESLRFDNESQSLFYSLNGTEFHHDMLTPPDELDQFYPQPRMLTADGYRLQVSRDNSLWVTLGDNSRKFNSSDVPKFEELASRLGVTMVIETKTQFFFVGNAAEDERSALQNVVNMKSHLAANGAQDAIIDIVSLDHDIILYTGFTENDYYKWTNQEHQLKQTIDLTDIIIPLRAANQSKYVPKVKVLENDLIISLPEFLESYPAQLVIVNGTKHWVSNRLQLLLSTTLMDLKIITDPVNFNESYWAIQPRPVVIPESMSIYDISPEDLEDGQEIKLGTSASNMGSLPSTSYSVAKNGEDLILTNIGSIGVLEKKTVVVSDFFETGESNNTRSKRSVVKGPELSKRQLAVPNSFQNIKIILPGLSLYISDSEIKTCKESGANLNFDLNNINSLEWLLQQTDEKLQTTNGNNSSDLK